MTSRTYDIDFQEAKAIIELRDEISLCEEHTAYCKDDYGTFRVSFTANEELTEITLRQPKKVEHDINEQGHDVLLETSEDCTFERGIEGVRELLSRC